MNQISEKNKTFDEKKEKKKIHCAIPKFILNNELLQKAIKKSFPENYNFEIYKCIDIILREKFKNIVLQLPEGLLIWGLYISEILYFFCDCVEDVIILGDVTYGGCCIDDYTSEKLHCDLIIHYGHSCLVPLTVTKIRCIYVFVDIKLNSSHLVETIKKNFHKSDIILLLGTIQFSCLVHNVHSILKKENYFDLFLPIPQVLPLTKGEVLGCTSPNLYRFLYEHVVRKGQGGEVVEKQTSQNGLSLGGPTQGEKYPPGDIPPKDDHNSHHSEAFIINECKRFLQKNQVKIVFIADGRFHLESLMIHNPDFSFYRYNPFNKVITTEKYNYTLFHEIRKNEIKKCTNCKSVCIILKIFNEKLALFKNVDVFIQIGCPRLSIDWGNYNSKPLLNSYEAYVFLQAVKYKEIYPMDYYANLGNVWTNYNAGIGDTSEKNLSMREIIRRRIQLRKSKISIRYQ
ncbi:diphthamide biosynthesis protein [Plasmodium cynomolgi strain B]|uniref:2-(3-amino-3-carboxypropyl)histidine synthase subunit 1 n=1 Tax=Plasmodium cynomolgi (strain B) TaxID=1120755 RepID=K6V0L4_PLACD|nr:diphthamide biosynthesis protein [Plasmodium cynomolgi strain B]GAB68555.1 diphthamide biosynthesis protein [Plasmodium cynomolgi strain B]